MSRNCFARAPAPTDPRGAGRERKGIAMTMADAVREYFAQVYPAVQQVRGLDVPELLRLFDRLDYFYSASGSAVSSLRPHVDMLRISELARVQLPYLPPGAYYRATGHVPLDGGRFNAIQWGSFERHQQPVEVLPSLLPALYGKGVTHFHSSFGARVGPQPSWTSPLAIVRYVHYPSGLQTSHEATSDAVQRRRIIRKASLNSDNSSYADVANRRKILILKQLRDGDGVEVELWGGLLGDDECPPICGTWANIWQGTGVLLRVRRPFVSLSKATALVEMFATLGARNATGLQELISALRAHKHVNSICSRYPSASAADCLAASMLSILPKVGGHRDPAFGMLAQQWEAFASRSRPQDVVRYVLQLISSDGMPSPPFTAAQRFALHWTFGIMGKGRNTPFWRSSPFGPDGLLAALACILGHQTVILAASANDNGLLHQELVDFELPEPLGWPAPADKLQTNDVQWCFTQPFGFVKADAQRGVRAQSLRRLQMLQYWRQTGKFRLPTQLNGTASQPTVPCDIAFGREGLNDGGAGELNACRGPKIRVPRPVGGKTCYAWCNGTMSHILSQVSLAHVRYHAGPTMTTS